MGSFTNKGAVICVAISIALWCSSTVSAKEYRYLGWETGGCKKCHKKQYESWVETPMANAFYSLEAGEKREEM